MGVLTISKTLPSPQTTTTTTTTTTNTNTQVNNILHLSLKFLNIEGVVRDNRCQISIPKSIPYYTLVNTVHGRFKGELQDVEFNSVELFSRTGYPLANSPSVFVYPLSSWYLEDNELIYVYPKVLKYESTFESDVDADGIVVNIPLKDSNVVYPFTFYTDRMFVCDLKTIISLRLHIPFNTISIWQYNKHKQQQELTVNNEEIPLKSINQQQLSFSISATYDDCDFLASFRSSLYTSHIPIPLPCFHAFNGQLLYLVREHLSKRDKARLKRELGFIRTISCSPPLVYSLFLLFSDYRISLPHRVAINEGIITTISLLSKRKSLTHFPELWMYVEKFAGSDHALTEVYETTFISKRTRDHPKDDETRRLIAVFPSSQDTITTWRDCPSSHEPVSHHLSVPLEECTPGVETRFPTQHPMELYRKFIQERTNYGLMLPLLQGLSSPCVFLDRTTGRYGYFDYFSPEDGLIHSYNPHDIAISSRLEISNRMSYQKIILILDLSADMNVAFDEYTASSRSLDMTQLQAALIVIETLINRIIGLECKYLLGAIVISNNFEFANGMLELQQPTFEYVHVLEQFKKSVDRYKPSFNVRRRSQGIILSVLDYCIDHYYSPSKYLQTKIYLFTNGSTQRKYYGSKTNSFEQRLQKSSCVLNSIILSREFAHVLEKLVKQTNGQHINYACICKYISNTTTTTTPPPTTHLCLEYGSCLEDNLHITNPDTKSTTYNLLSRQISNKLLTTDEFFETTHKHKQQYEDMLNNNVVYLIQILRKIGAYIKAPNPYCKLFPYNNDILKWLVFIQGPPHTPFDDSVLIMEMVFEENFPIFPPKLRFMTLLYHPNVSYSGNVCLPILSEDWNVGISLKDVFDSLLMMLENPIRSHFVRSKVADIYYTSRQLYNSMVISLLDIKMLSEKNFANIEQDFKIKSNSNSTAMPIALTCPLTNQLFDTPVVTPDGNTYELLAVLKVIENEGIDPVSNSPLLERDLIPNHAIADAVLKHRRKMFSRSYWWDD